MKKEGKAYYRGNTYLLAGVRLQKVGRGNALAVHHRLKMTTCESLPHALRSALVMMLWMLHPQVAPSEQPTSRHSYKDGVIASSEQPAAQRVANNVVPKPALGSAPRPTELHKADSDLTDELLSVLTAF